MRCPSCQRWMVPTEIGGIEIDACPRCRGLWLDGDELDAIERRESAGSRPGEDEDDAPRRGWLGRAEDEAEHGFIYEWTIVPTGGRR